MADDLGDRERRGADGAGAVGAVVSRSVENAMSLLQVADTQVALGRLGAFNRELYTGPLVAITGSSGKTTANDCKQGNERLVQ